MTDVYTGPSERLTITPDKDPAVVARHVARYERALEMADLRTGGRWLDCACGTGYGTRLVASRVQPVEVWGVDRDPDAISYARRNYASSRIRFRDLDIEHVYRWMHWLGPFDAVLSLETLEHLEPDTQELWVSHVLAGLTPGGTFVVACPIGSDGPSAYNRYHVHEPSLGGLEDLLSRHFGSVEIETEEYVDTGGREAVQAFAVCR